MNMKFDFVSLFILNLFFFNNSLFQYTKKISYNERKLKFREIKKEIFNPMYLIRFFFLNINMIWFNLIYLFLVNKKF